MMFFKRLLVTLTLVFCLGIFAFPAAAYPQNDTDNHIDVDNTSYVIPTRVQYLGAENGWVRDEKNLITNFYSMYQPEVIYVPEKDNGTDYPYMMWFFAWSYNQENDKQGKFPGFPGGDATFTARAKALEGPWEIWSKNWETGEEFWDTEQNPFYWQPVIVCQDTWYDSWHVGDPSVVYKDGKFYMAYSAMGTDTDGIPWHLSGDTDGNTSCIMGATSTDGLHWTLSKKPLLVWENEQDFNEKATVNGYYGGYQRPSLMWEDGKWKCWFDYQKSTMGVFIGYAESTGDFLNADTWERQYYNNKSLVRSVDFDVVKIGSVYYAYGDPYIDWYGIRDNAIPQYDSDPSRWSGRQIVEFQSLDGLDWKATGYFRPDTGYPANQIPQVFLDHKNSRVCILYATQRGFSQGASSYDWRWDNIRMMWRDLSLFADPAVKVTPGPTPSPTIKPTRTPRATPTPSLSAQPTFTTAAATPAPANTARTAAIISAGVLALTAAAALVYKLAGKNKQRPGKAE